MLEISSALQRKRSQPLAVKYLDKPALLLVKKAFWRTELTETESILGFYSSASGIFIFSPSAGLQLKSYLID